MSRTRFVSAAALALAATAAPAHATYVAVEPTCLTTSTAAICPPLFASAGADVLLAGPSSSPSGVPHTLTPACTWQRIGGRLELATWAVAPSSVWADTTCQFRVDSTTYMTHTQVFIHGGTAWGTLMVPDGATVTACFVSSAAGWADGHQINQLGCRPS